MPERDVWKGKITAEGGFSDSIKSQMVSHLTFCLFGGPCWA